MNPRSPMVALVFLLLSGVLFSCGSEPSTNSPGRQVKIGVAMDSLSVERWKRDLDLFTAEAKKSGASVVWRAANTDADTQYRQVVELLDQRIDVLVLVAADSTKAAEATREAQRRGVPVISYDRPIPGGEVNLAAGFDSHQVGVLMAQSLLSRGVRGSVLLINGAPTDRNAFEFREGMLAELRPLIDEGSIRLLPEEWAEGWAVDEAYRAVDRLLGKGLVPGAILAANDGLAGGAIQALAERRLAGVVPVVGSDADLLACKRVVEGTQWATVYKPIKALAEAAAQAAIALARNKHSDVSPILIDPILVTRDTMRSVFADGSYHALAEIFQNLAP